MAAGAGRSPARSIDSATCRERWGLRLSKTTTSPGGVPGPAPDRHRSGTPACRSPGENQRRPYPIQAQGSDHGRRTPRGGHRALGPLTPPRPGVGRRHRRIDPRLVDENQPSCLDSPHLRPVSPPLGLHLGSVPLAGMQGLLLVGQAEAAEGGARGSSGCRRSRPTPSIGSRWHRDARRSASPVVPVRGNRGPAAARRRGLGGQGAASRRLWRSRVTNETLTRNRLAI